MRSSRLFLLKLMDDFIKEDSILLRSSDCYNLLRISILVLTICRIRDKLIDVVFYKNLHNDDGLCLNKSMSK